MAGVHRHMHCAHVTGTGHYQPGELGDWLFVQRKGLVKAENMAVAVDQQHWDFGLRRQGQQSFANAGTETRVRRKVFPKALYFKYVSVHGQHNGFGLCLCGACKGFSLSLIHI